ncbi:ABC transporter permease [Haladaptatus sp. R4]|uniref:ABC transporter permease n=1 Tax=Haladaptatus sp. R4 TaxID=1679489 RepID=UPI001680EDE2|nr:ABC transporter permease [Haladaptatus sp. R4]
MSPTEKRTDGGNADASDLPFEQLSPDTMTRGERYRSTIQEWVIAPIQIIWSDRRARVGSIIILFYILMGTVGVMLVPPTQPGDGAQLIKPFQNFAHPLGTDNLGDDLLARTIHATPAMLEMITAGALFTTVLATIVGALSGYKGGNIDRILMTITDILITIPGLPLVIVIAVILNPKEPWMVGIILTINAWAGLARAIRSQVLTLRNESFVEASRLMGISTPTIILKDIVPGLMPYITVNFVNSARGVIFSSVALYFLGILPFTNRNWGVMLNLAYSTGGALYSINIIHWLLVPMITIILLSLGLILFAQGTDRIFNPRVRARHMTVNTEQFEEDGESRITTESQIKN